MSSYSVSILTIFRDTLNLVLKRITVLISSKTSFARKKTWKPNLRQFQIDQKFFTNKSGNSESLKNNRSIWKAL